MGFSIGRSGFHLAAVANLWDTQSRSYDTNELRAELVINADQAKAFFLALELDRQTIDAELGGLIVWHNPENARMCRIYVRRTSDLEDLADWPNQHRWLLERLDIFQKAFAPRIRVLDPLAMP